LSRFRVEDITGDPGEFSSNKEQEAARDLQSVPYFIVLRRSRGSRGPRTFAGFHGFGHYMAEDNPARAGDALTDLLANPL
jgi:hypothetical protein